MRTGSPIEEKGIVKRFHVHLAVADLPESIRFYSTLFGVQPAVQKPDYAKWMVEDPRINFAISARGSTPGVNHLGFQIDSDDELRDMRERLARADAALTEESGAHCCYAISDKYWVTDPQGIAWETYHTLGEIPMFGANATTATASPAHATGPRGTDTAQPSCCGAPESSVEAPATPARCAPAQSPVGATIPVRAGTGCCS
jgi:catechol 2,3-dioxygenase-like lactoylglutathione lyase family enzyme